MYRQLKIKNSRLGLWLRKLWSQFRLPLSPVCDDSCSIHPSVRFSGHVENIRLGKNVKICADVHIHCHSNGLIEIGDGTTVEPHVELSTGISGGSIRVGKNCSINAYSVVYGHGGCIIGDRAMLAAFVTIIPFNHRFEDLSIPIAKQGLSHEGIVVQRNVWLGAGVRVLDGVTIGEGTVVGAAAVVSRSLPPESVAVGIPARVIKVRTAASQIA